MCFLYEYTKGSGLEGGVDADYSQRSEAQVGRRFDSDSASSVMGPVGHGAAGN